MNCKELICIKLLLFFSFVFACFLPVGLHAQDSTSHRFTTLFLEARAEFDITGEQYGLQGGAFDDTLHYGFTGKYFNLCLGGEFGKGFSYYFRQRIIANRGTASLFDNTDFLYIQYRFKDNWAVRLGKEALAIGGFEYDAPPIDVFCPTSFWSQVYCFQLAAHVSYTDNEGRNKVTLQVANSPYVHYMGTGSEWKQGFLGYSLMWSGNFPHFQTLYSVNFFERKRGKFANYIALGNRLQFGWWSWYFDYQNRTFSMDNHFFDNLSVVSRMDFKIKSVKIFLKAGYEQNMADEAVVHDPTIEVMDPMMSPAQRRLFYGLGVEYRPEKCPSIRLHAYVCRYSLTSKYDGMESCSGITGNVGISWKIDFLRYFKRLKENNTQ